MLVNLRRHFGCYVTHFTIATDTVDMINIFEQHCLLTKPKNQAINAKS